ncbi:hypothetical protein BMR11_06595 [Methylococcaceae bacterium CS5]|nr:hypothetical protein BMR11_06595 [Methylococcaceae bacterium CS5]
MLWFVSAYLGLIFSRITLRMVLHSIRNRGLNQRHIVLVGGSPLNQQVTKKLESSSWMGLKIAGYFYHNNENQDLEYLGDIDTVVQYVEQHDIDQVWITLPLTQMDKIERLSRQLHSVTVDVMLIPDIASLRLLNYSTGAPCYLTKFRDSCRHNSFTYAADGRCPERPASATTTHKSRFVITTSLAGRLFGMQFLLLSRAASTRRISELPCRLSGTKNHHFAKLRFHDFQRKKPAYKAIGNRFNILSRLRCNNVLYDLPEKRKPKQRGRNKKYGQRLGSATDMAKTVQQEARFYNVNLYGKQREVSAYSRVVMLKTLKRPVQVVWVFRRTQWIALFTTDLNLSITQIIEYYGARWKIESGFKELKQDIGSQKSQCRNAQAVTNHLNFCMMATTLTWIYADRLKTNPERRHKVKGRTSFAFSDIRRIIAEAALDPDFERVCPKYSSSPVNSVVTVLLRMVA